MQRRGLLQQGVSEGGLGQTQEALHARDRQGDWAQGQGAGRHQGYKYGIDFKLIISYEVTQYYLGRSYFRRRISCYC